MTTATPADLRARRARLRVGLNELSERTGYRIVWLSRVLNGHETSAPLLSAVDEALDAIERERGAVAA